MANSGGESTLDAVSMALRAVNRLSTDPASSGDIHSKLTPATLAGAIKLASLSPEHQNKLTSANVTHAVKLARSNTLEKMQIPAGFTMESLAVALKVALHNPPAETGKWSPTKTLESNPAVVAFRAAVALGPQGQEHEPVTTEILNKAIQLAKK